MNQLIINQLTMSSREIAELTGKQHKHVLDDIRKLLNELNINSAEFSAQYKDISGKDNPMFNLPKRECLILVSGYSIQLRAKIIDRWQELENQQTHKLPTSYREAIAQLLIEIDAKEEAIRTKAEIGNRREATSMATASAATKQRNAMAITIDKHQQWASVLRVEQVTGQKYSWKPLKEYCIANGLEIKKVDSGLQTRFSQVNTYPAESWFECYSVDITEFK